MAETLGTLADKLTTVKLKLWHTDNPERARSLKAQEKQLQDEINEFVTAAMSGDIPIERLTFAANKVYKKEGNVVADFEARSARSFLSLPKPTVDCGTSRKKYMNLKRCRCRRKTA